MNGVGPTLANQLIAEIGDVSHPLSSSRFTDHFCRCCPIQLLMVLFAARVQERRLLAEGEVQESLQGFLAELPMLLSQNLQKCA